jgi:hypothetical protein
METTRFGREWPWVLTLAASLVSTCLCAADALVLGSPLPYDGPQTDDLRPEFRRSDKDHFNEEGVRRLGILFARQISRAFFPPAIPTPQPPLDATP